MPCLIQTGKPRNTSTCGLEDEFSLCLKVDEPEKKLVVGFLVQGHRPEREEVGEKEVRAVQVDDLEPGVQL